MSVRKMAEVWDTDLPSTEKLVLLAYADHANDEGLCYPGNSHIAKKASKSPGSIKRITRWLRAHGYLVLVQPGGGTQRTVVRVVPNPNR